MLVESLPVAAGIGFKPEHGDCVLQSSSSAFEWLEIHPENYMVEGGERLKILEKISSSYPISFHSVGLSLGSVAPVRSDHLQSLADLIQIFQPAQVSDHLSWSQTDLGIVPDLLPVPYTQESMSCFENNIQRVQDKLKRSILIENPSVYLRFNIEEFFEPDFLNQLCKTSGCGLLLDVNNVYVSSANQETCAKEYLQAIDYQYVQEIHLAGHSLKQIEDTSIRIDDHGSSMQEDVLDLLRYVQQISGRKFPTLIEWDTNVPEFSVLLQEAKRIQEVINS